MSRQKISCHLDFLMSQNLILVKKRGIQSTTIVYKQNPYISALPSKIFAEHKSNDNDRCGDKVTDSESEELNKNLLCNNTQETLECFTSQLTSEPNNGNVYLLSENDSRSSVTSQPIQRAPI